jgi:predicted kinase
MEAVVFIGVQGSGKTSFYHERFADTHRHISLDIAGSRERERRLLAECLAAARPFVVDNTNVTAADRRPYIEAAKRAGYRVDGYFFDTELKPAIARNGKRTGGRKVPIPALIRAFKRMEPPRLAEGFDRIIVVRLTGENEFRTGAYSEPGPDRR